MTTSKSKTEKKVVSNVDDYQLISNFISNLTIPIAQSKQALEVLEALNRGVIMDALINDKPLIPEK
jgi:hypothetical protein